MNTSSREELCSPKLQKKKRLVEMSKTEQVDRAMRPGAPQRVLKSLFILEWRNLADHEKKTKKLR
ncbi:hypothetical protein Hanom_Chr16g01492631 [Helianthus anomalus]